MAQAKRSSKASDQDLIERYIDPEWGRYPGGRADTRLKDDGVPVWALVGQIRATGDDLDQLAQSYLVPREAVDAAMAYYRRNKKYIDVRLLLNSA